MNHLRNALHNVGSGENLATQLHDLGDALAVTREFHDLCRNNGDRFRIVQAQPSRLPLSCHFGSDINQELFLFALSKMHVISARKSCAAVSDPAHKASAS